MSIIIPLTGRQKPQPGRDAVNELMRLKLSASTAASAFHAGPFPPFFTPITLKGSKVADAISYVDCRASSFEVQSAISHYISLGKSATLTRIKGYSKSQLQAFSFNHCTSEFFGKLGLSYPLQDGRLTTTPVYCTIDSDNVPAYSIHLASGAQDFRRGSFRAKFIIFDPVQSRSNQWSGSIGIEYTQVFARNRAFGNPFARLAINARNGWELECPGVIQSAIQGAESKAGEFCRTLGALCDGFRSSEPTISFHVSIPYSLAMKKGLLDPPSMKSARKANNAGG